MNRNNDQAALEQCLSVGEASRIFGRSPKWVRLNIASRCLDRAPSSKERRLLVTRQSVVRLMSILAEQRQQEATQARRHLRLVVDNTK